MALADVQGQPLSPSAGRPDGPRPRPEETRLPKWRSGLARAPKSLVALASKSSLAGKVRSADRQLGKLQRLTQPYFLPLRDTTGWHFAWLLLSLLFVVGGGVMILLAYMYLSLSIYIYTHREREIHIYIYIYIYIHIYIYIYT